MPITFYDQFYEVDPYAPPPVGTTLGVLYLEVNDDNANNNVNSMSTDTIDGEFINSILWNTKLTVNMFGSDVTITGAIFYLADGRILFSPTDGTRLYTATFQNIVPGGAAGSVPNHKFGPPCFCPGTLVATENGAVPVETIRIGDRVVTRDSGLQPVIWAGSSLAKGDGSHAAIEFRAGAIGNRRTLRVSPQHRVLVSGWRAELMAGSLEVFVAALHMANGQSIVRAPCREIEYFHLMLPHHHVLESEGAWTESFFPGDEIMKDPTRQAEIERTAGCLSGFGPTARPTLARYEALALVA